MRTTVLKNKEVNGQDLSTRRYEMSESKASRLFTKFIASQDEFSKISIDRDDYTFLVNGTRFVTANGINRVYFNGRVVDSLKTSYEGNADMTCKHEVKVYFCVNSSKFFFETDRDISENETNIVISGIIELAERVIEKQAIARITEEFKAAGKITVEQQVSTGLRRRNRSLVVISDEIKAEIQALANEEVRVFFEIEESEPTVPTAPTSSKKKEKKEQVSAIEPITTTTPGGVVGIELSRDDYFAIAHFIEDISSQCSDRTFSYDAKLKFTVIRESKVRINYGSKKIAEYIVATQEIFRTAEHKAFLLHCDTDLAIYARIALAYVQASSPANFKFYFTRNGEKMMNHKLEIIIEPVISVEKQAGWNSAAYQRLHQSLNQIPDFYVMTFYPSLYIDGHLETITCTYQFNPIFTTGEEITIDYEQIEKHLLAHCSEEQIEQYQLREKCYSLVHDFISENVGQEYLSLAKKLKTRQEEVTAVEESKGRDMRGWRKAAFYDQFYRHV